MSAAIDYQLGEAGYTGYVPSAPSAPGSWGEFWRQANGNLDLALRRWIDVETVKAVNGGMPSPAVGGSGPVLGAGPQLAPSQLTTWLPLIALGVVAVLVLRD